VATKICTKCKKQKDLEEFCIDKRAKDGKASHCRKCFNEWYSTDYRKRPSVRKSHLRASKKYREKYPDRVSKANLKWFYKVPNRHRLIRYGITEERFAVLVEAQQGKCAICKTEKPEGRWGVWQIDHDHSCCTTQAKCCGKCVRGLLCFKCNFMLGMYETNILPRIDKFKEYISEAIFRRSQRP
jgi:hypothetical protein